MDGLNRPAQRFFHPSQKGSTVMTIAPNELQTGKRILEWLEQGSAALVIRGLGSCHLHSQQIALRIDQCMTLAAPRFFSRRRSPFQDPEPHSF